VLVTKITAACKLCLALSGEPTQKLHAMTLVRRWAFAAVPLAGLLELVAHVVQTHGVVPDSDWKTARAYVAKEAQKDDLVAFAPRWTDPIGREIFGREIATLEREGRPDETRFPRALEVSIRGAHVPALASWSKAGEQRFGGVTVTTWTNPAPSHVIDDLVSHVDANGMRVARSEQDCPFVHAGAESGSLGYGPGVPADRFACPAGGFVGKSVVTDLDYYPHRCIYAPPQGGPPVRLTFVDVAFGQTLHGHHAIYVEAERNRQGAPVTLTFKAGGVVLGSVVHNDGDGWKPFELDTSSLSGQRADLVAEVSAPNGNRRQYCFEADTR
jgi:hypothetical protein